MLAEADLDVAAPDQPKPPAPIAIAPALLRAPPGPDIPPVDAGNGRVNAIVDRRREPLQHHRRPPLGALLHAPLRPRRQAMCEFDMI